jgi:hypothetical protein
MMREINLFLFILSSLYFIKFLFEFIVKFFQENPTPLELSNVEKILVYLSVSYLITFILILSGV